MNICLKYSAGLCFAFMVNKLVCRRPFAVYRHLKVNSSKDARQKCQWHGVSSKACSFTKRDICPSILISHTLCTFMRTRPQYYKVELSQLEDVEPTADCRPRAKGRFVALGTPSWHGCWLARTRWAATRALGHERVRTCFHTNVSMFVIIEFGPNMWGLYIELLVLLEPISQAVRLFWLCLWNRYQCE